MKGYTHIFHVVSPDGNGYDQKKLYDVIETMFLDILMKTEKTKLRSLTLPLICSGKANFLDFPKFFLFVKGNSNVPLYLCNLALYTAIEKYIQNTNPQTRCIKQIRIANIRHDINQDLMKFFKLQICKEGWYSLKFIRRINYSFFFYQDENFQQVSTITNVEFKKQISIQTITDNDSEFSFIFEGLRVEILNENLVDVIAKVIVNAANNNLQLICIYF
jgi:hypothetical protein